jgi:hypothetical protein
LRPARSRAPGSHVGSTITMPGGLIRPWPDGYPTRHTGQQRWRDWRPDNTQNQAYPSRQTVQQNGTTSNVVGGLAFLHLPGGGPLWHPHSGKERERPDDTCRLDWGGNVGVRAAHTAGDNDQALSLTVRRRVHPGERRRTRRHWKFAAEPIMEPPLCSRPLWIVGEL